MTILLQLIAKKSIELKGKDVLNLSFLAEIFLVSNNYNEAIKLLRGLELDKNINSLFNLAKAYSDLELKIAENYYNEVIKNDPTNIGAKYELIKINNKYLTNDLLKKVEKKMLMRIQIILIVSFQNLLLLRILKEKRL